jgi:nucleoside phosphorylase
LYEVAALPTSYATWQAVLLLTGRYNTPSAVQVERAIAVFRPQVVIFVGVAGGLRDARIGDVVAASAVYNYEAGMDTDAGLLPRIQTMPSSFRLVQHAHSVVREDRWPLRIKPVPPGTPPAAVVRPVAAGTKVVAGSGSETARLIADNCGDAQGVEMEGFGILYAAHTNKDVDALVIRGISDLLEKNKIADQSAQPMAARHAAAFAFEMLHKLRPEVSLTRAGGSAPYGNPLLPMVAALHRAWHALEPSAVRRELEPDSPVWQALEAVVARAIVDYVRSDGRLDIAGPLLGKQMLLADPGVAAEFAKLLAGQGTPDAGLIGRRWRLALADPTHTRDFTVEAEALLELFRAPPGSAELGAWVRGSQHMAESALPEISATARQSFAEVASIAGRVTVGSLPPALRMRLYDQTSIIAGHVSGFVGRDAILARIKEVIKSRDSAYCHVLAHPGVGKTALMAALVSDGDYIHHFNIRTSGVVSPQAFLGNVCARLIARYQPGRAVPDPESLSDGAYLSALLSEVAAARCTDKVVIVVDALDESDTKALLPGTNPLFLPASLPATVIFVVASRPVGEMRPVAEWQPMQITADCDQVVVPIDHLGDDNMADIREYLARWSAKDGIASYMARFGYRAVTFIEELAGISEGNFMYLRHVLPAINSGELNDHELAALPLGLRQYYADHLERMRDENDDLWYRYRLPVIAAFVQAGSRPLTIAEIAAVSGIGIEAIVRDTLRRWSAFVVAEPVLGEDGTPRLAYRIYHSSFAEFLDASI